MLSQPLDPTCRGLGFVNLETPSNDLLMDQLKIVLSALTGELAKCGKKGKKEANTAIEQLNSHLLLLKPLTVSGQVAARLIGLCRKSLSPLYHQVPRAALDFASHLIQFLYDDKILPAYTSGNACDRANWEAILTAVLSGVLDHLDKNDNVQTKEAIGAALYPILCLTSFSLSIPHLSVQLRCTMYSLLSDAASAHKPNQDRLRDPTVLGGYVESLHLQISVINAHILSPRLGDHILRTKDFLVLEALLNLFARMIPSTNNTAAGRTRRTAFIKSVFLSRGGSTSEKLVAILEDVPTSDWDQTASKLVKTLADSDVTFPQPFVVKQVVACEKSFPSDRIFLDDKGFCANVLLEDGQYESLEVAYAAVRAISIVCKPTESTKGNPNPEVRVQLALPPTLGKESVLTPSQDSGRAATLSFAIDWEDIPRIRSGFDNRGLTKVLKVMRNSKSSLPDSVANLEMDVTGARLLDKSERYEALTQLYGTNEPSEEDVSPTNVASTSSEVRQAPSLGGVQLHEARTNSGQGAMTVNGCHDEKPTVNQNQLTHAVQSRSEAMESNTITTPKPLRRTASQTMRDAIFGSSDEELSDIESPTPAMAPPTQSQDLTQRLKRPTLRRAPVKTIIDSDMEKSPTSISTERRKHTKTQKDRDDLLEDEIEEVLPPTVTLSISRKPSALNLVPIKPSCRAGISLGNNRQSNSARRSLRSNQDGSTIQRPDIKRSPGLPNAPGETIGNRSNPKQELSVADAKPDKHVVFSSSPVRPRRRSAKTEQAGLTKLSAPTAESLPAQPPKRKRQVSDADDAQLSAPRPSKKTRSTTNDDNDSIPSEITESQVLRPRRTAATRATRRYGGKKRQTSSPVPSCPSDIDYDEIPDGSPSPQDRKDFARAGKPPKKLQNIVPTRVKVEKSPKSEADVLPKQRKKRMTDTKAVVKGDPADAQPTKTELSRKPLRRSPRKPQNAQDATQNVTLPVSVGKGDRKQPPPVIINDVDDASVVEVSVSAKPPATTKKSDKAPWLISTKLEKQSKSITIPEVHENFDIPGADSEAHEGIKEDPGSKDIHEERSAKAPTEKSIPHRDVTHKPAHVAAISEKSTPPRRVLPVKTKGSDDLLSPNLEDIFKSEPRPRRPTPAPNYDIASTAKSPRVLMKKMEPLKIISPRPPALVPAHGGGSAHQNYSRPQTLRRPAEGKPSRGPAGLEDITSVLDEINEVILRKLSGKIGVARANANAGKMKVLSEAAEDLRAMNNESTNSFNRLITLESSYAEHGRKLANALDDYVRLNQGVYEDLEKVLETHDRNGVQNMPKTLFPGALPHNISKYLR